MVLFKGSKTYAKNHLMCVFQSRFTKATYKTDTIKCNK